MPEYPRMKQAKAKTWVKPILRKCQLSCECTSYAGTETGTDIMK